MSKVRPVNLKRNISVWREGLDLQKNASTFLRSIFIPTHHVLCFDLVFLSVTADLVGKRFGGEVGLVNFVNSLPKVYSKVP